MIITVSIKIISAVEFFYRGDTVVSLRERQQVSTNAFATICIFVIIVIFVITRGSAAFNRVFPKSSALCIYRL